MLHQKCELGDCENRAACEQKFSDVYVVICLEHRADAYQIAMNFTIEWKKAITALALQFIEEIQQGKKA